MNKLKSKIGRQHPGKALREIKVTLDEVFGREWTDFHQDMRDLMAKEASHTLKRIIDEHNMERFRANRPLQNIKGAEYLHVQ